MVLANSYNISQWYFIKYTYKLASIYMETWVSKKDNYQVLLYVSSMITVLIKTIKKDTEF